MLTYDFDPEAKLEIQLSTRGRRPFGKMKKIWVKVHPNMFRSYHGNRRVNGKKFEGQIFYYDSNTDYRSSTI